MSMSLFSGKLTVLSDFCSTLKVDVSCDVHVDIRLVDPLNVFDFFVCTITRGDYAVTRREQGIKVDFERFTKALCQFFIDVQQQKMHLTFESLKNFGDLNNISNLDNYNNISGTKNLKNPNNPGTFEKGNRLPSDGIYKLSFVENNSFRNVTRLELLFYRPDEAEFQRYLKAIIARFESDNVKLLRETMALKESVQRASEEAGSAKAESQASVSRFEALFRKCAFLEDELTQARTLLKSKDNQILNSQQELQVILKSKDDQIISSQSELQKLLKSKDEQIANIQNEVQRLLKGKDDQMVSIQGEMMELRQFKDELDRVKLLLSSKDDQIKRQNDQISEMYSKSEDTRKQIYSLENRNDDFKQKIRDMKTQLDDLKTQITEQMTINDDQLTTIEDLKESKKLLREDIKRLRKQINDQREIKKALNEELKDVRRATNEYSNEINALQNELIQKDIRITEYERQITALKKNLEAAQNVQSYLDKKNNRREISEEDTSVSQIHPESPPH